MHLVVGGLLPSRAIRPYPQPGEGVGQNQSLASGAGGDPWSQASAPRAQWTYDAIWKPVLGASVGRRPGLYAQFASKTVRRSGGYITARTLPNASNDCYGITAVG